MIKNIPMANLSLETLIRECRKTRRPKEDIFWDFSLRNRENIHEIFKYKKFNYDFTDLVTCYNDGEHVIGYIRPSYDDFLSNVMRFLGAKPRTKIEDNEELTQELLGRIERLKQIRSEQELELEFPYLYNDLIQGRKFIRSTEKMKRTTEEEQKRYEEQRHYYYACALKQRLDRFIETQSDFYTRLVTKRKEYQDLISNRSYNRYIRENFDLNKVAMYTVHTYLTICESTEDREIISRYMPLIEKYEKSNYDKSVSIRTNDYRIITWPNIKNRIQNLREKMKRKEINLEWELVPNGRDYTRVEKPYESGIREVLLTRKDMDKLREVGEKKQSFYESSPYLARAKGLLRYRGYIGYIYPNGEVLLDREYNIDSPRTAKGNAIYNMKVGDFEELSGLDKSVLRHHSKVGRIIHSVHWEEKAKKIINREGTEEEREASLQLVKRLEEKRTK